MYNLRKVHLRMTKSTEKESQRMLESFRENFSLEHINGIDNYLSRIKNIKKIFEEKDKSATTERLRSIATNCLNNGKCAEWLGAVQKVDFSRLGKPSTPEGHCFYANAQSLVSLVSRISDPGKNDFWGTVEAAHIAAKNLKKYYEEGGVNF